MTFRFSAEAMQESQRRWRDGSLEEDLPMRSLSEMFNVNYFLVSQTNPHIVPALNLKKRVNRKLGNILEAEWKHRHGPHIVLHIAIVLSVRRCFCARICRSMSVQSSQEGMRLWPRPRTPLGYVNHRLSCLPVEAGWLLSSAGLAFGVDWCGWMAACNKIAEPGSAHQKG